VNAAELLREIERGGHTVLLDDDTLVVRPAMPAALRECVRARKPEFVAYLREHAGKLPTASVAHRYVLWSGTVDRSRSVCIACGRPPGLHGAAALEGARLVDDLNEVALITAREIVAAAAARQATS